MQTRTSLTPRCHVRQTNPKGEVWHFMQQCVCVMSSLFYYGWRRQGNDDNLKTTVITMRASYKVPHRSTITSRPDWMCCTYLNLLTSVCIYCNNSFLGSKCITRNVCLRSHTLYMYKSRRKWWSDAITSAIVRFQIQYIVMAREII